MPHWIAFSFFELKNNNDKIKVGPFFNNFLEDTQNFKTKKSSLIYNSSLSIKAIIVKFQPFHGQLMKGATQK